MGAILSIILTIVNIIIYVDFAISAADGASGIEFIFVMALYTLGLIGFCIFLTDTSISVSLALGILFQFFSSWAMSGDNPNAFLLWISIALIGTAMCSKGIGCF